LGGGFLLEGRESLPDNRNENSQYPKFHPLILADIEYQEKRNRFKHMKYIGTSKILKGMVPNSPEDDKDVMFMSIKDKYPQFEKLHNLAEHRSSVCNPETYETSIKKCDVERKMPQNEKMDLAYKYTKIMLNYLVDAKIQSKVEYEPSTGVGVPQNRIINPETGKYFQNKGEYLNSQYAQEEMKYYYTEIFSAMSKIEFLPLEDIKVGKSRTFFCGNTPLVIRQKMLYDRMDERMINRTESWFTNWSRYGFTRQYGGFHRLASAHRIIEDEAKKRKLEEWIRHITADVSGWDRAAPLMEQVYKLRRELYGHMTPEEAQIHEYILESIVKPYFVTFQGDIYQRETGNCSGSGKTTSDNTIMHIMMEFYVWISLYSEKHGKLPEYNDIVNKIVNSLYGDDNLGSFILVDWVPDEIVEKDEYFSDKYRSYYEEFGLTIKPSQYKIQKTLEGLEFLGGFLRYDEKSSTWIAKPRISKVATTLCYQLEGDRTIEQYSSIIQAISALVYNIEDEDCELIREYLKVLANEILIQMRDDELSVDEISFLTRVALGSINLDELVMGFEGKLFSANYNKRSNFFFSLQSKRDRVGFKSEKMMKYQNFDQNINYKGVFKELCDKNHHRMPEFEFSKIGPDHIPTFVCRVIWFSHEFKDHGNSKLDAEQRVCFKMLAYYEINEADKYTRTWEESSLERARKELEKLQIRTPQVESKTLFNAGGEGLLNTRQIEQEKNFMQVQKSEVPKQERVSINEIRECEKKFFSNLLSEMADYYRLPVEYRQHHPMYKILEDPQAAARLAQKFKEGSFNPYGNGQTEQFVLTRPTFQIINETTATCYSTCLLPNAVNILGTGTTVMEAFESWVESVNEYIIHWAPPNNPKILELFYLLKSCPREKVPKYYSFILDDTEDVAIKKFYEKFREGSFNPYGNGQPAPLTRSMWMKANAQRIGAMDQKAQDAAYAKYLKKHKKRNGKKQAQKSKNAYMSSEYGFAKKPISAKKQETGYETRADIKLSGCAKHYGTALAYPFAWLDASSFKHVKINLDDLPCIPKFPAVKSRKSKYYVRGQSGIQNANDVCFVVMAPWRLANDNPLNDNVSSALLFTIPTAPYVGVGFPTLDNGAAWVSGAANFNTPYTRAQLINVNKVGIKYRVVGASLRIKYIGNNLNMGGMINAFTDPNHGTVSNKTVVQMSQFDTYFSYSVISSTKRNDGWVYLTYTPVSEEDYEYFIDSVSAGTTGTESYKNHFMGFVITGLPIGESIQWEAILLTEEIGQNVPDKTDTPADPTGVAIATNSVKAETQKKINDNIPVKSLLTEGASDLTTTGMNIVSAPIVKTAMDILPKLL
jgi:hypothetical protein